MSIPYVTINMEQVELLASKNYWTITDLAKRSRLSYATLHALKTGRRRASLKTLVSIAKALGVKPDDILPHSAGK